jgi:gliding motility-associated protein GldC
MAVAHRSDIKINIGLDENRVPEEMNWSAPDSGVDNAKTKAAMISIWDEKAQETLRIDLWTKDMPLDQMKKYIHQNLMAMADTLERAGGEADYAKELREYALDLGERMNVLKRG